MDDARPGTYCLLLRLNAPTRLTIGRLGAFDFAAGWYTYVGSAFGGGGLRGRLKHHLSPVTRPHWHIDYLRSAAVVCEIWTTANETVVEHAWAQRLLAQAGSHIPAPRFGASDCRCPTHLIYRPTKPDVEVLRAAGDWPVERWPLG